MKPFDKITAFVISLMALVGLSYVHPIFRSYWYEYGVSILFLVLLFGSAIILILGMIIQYFLMYPNGRTFVIKNGKHRSVWRFNPFLKSKNTLDVTDVFKIQLNNGYDSYLFTSNQLKEQCNKIVGKNWGFPKYDFKEKRWVHRNSLRIAFRVMDGINKFEFLYYGYYNGVRFEKHYMSMVVRKGTNLEMLINESLYKLIVRDCLGVDVNDIELPRFGYYLFNYFGGSAPYPGKEIRTTIYKDDVFSDRLSVRENDWKTIHSDFVRTLCKK